ncbi:2013_t:CDS:2 [Ambispora leptoticha]|uniref:Non-homologous end-joining factor 1 n=1 Tax=Ambispora leptoticha TaxID=144679 RepID=A0A9N9FBL8_9GLOM|nr:2013_t:CDS:2 [Ambispora leptoticha]
MALFTKEHDELLSAVNWVALSATSTVATNGSSGLLPSTTTTATPKTTNGEGTAALNTTFLVKSYFSTDRYLVLITNLKYVWLEELIGDDIKKRCKDTKSGLDPDDLESLLKSLPSFLKNLPNLTHVLRKTNDELELKSTRTLKWGELFWNFRCKLIPNAHTLRDEDEEYDLDGASILYKHYVLPQRMLLVAYYEQIKALVDVIKSQDDELKELDLLREQQNVAGKLEKSHSKKKPRTPFDDENTFQEIEKRLQSFKISTGQIPLENLIDSRTSHLFSKATERIMEEYKEEEELKRKKSLHFEDRRSSAPPPLPATGQNNDDLDDELFRTPKKDKAKTVHVTKPQQNVSPRVEATASSSTSTNLSKPGSSTVVAETRRLSSPKAKIDSVTTQQETAETNNENNSNPQESEEARRRQLQELKNEGVAKKRKKKI